MNQGITKYNTIILAVFALVVAAVILYMYFHIESFLDVSPSNTSPLNLFNESSYEKNRMLYDSIYEKNRTKLYGSLFLDKLNEQIKGMTDPPIQYDTKRIDIIKYADVLL